MKIKAVLFDFGGVLAEEGFRQGLMAIAGQYDLDPQAFFTLPLKLFMPAALSPARPVKLITGNSFARKRKFPAGIRT